MKIILGSVIVTLACLGAVPCGDAIFEAGSPAAAVIDEIRWKTHWLGRTPFGSSGDSGIAILAEDPYVGYCIAAWDQCLLFKRRAVGNTVYQMDGSRFEAQRASGLWAIRGGLTMQEAADNGGVKNRGDVTLNGRVIRDPASDPKTGPRQQNALTLILRACTLDALQFGTTVPNAIRNHQRPKQVASLIRAIRQQDLLKNSRGIVVPFFGDSDEDVFIKVEKPGGDVSIMLVVQREDFWVFRPHHAIGAKLSMEDLSRKIAEAAMVKLLPDGLEEWVQ